LENDGRLEFTITIQCDSLKEMVQQQNQDAQYVSATVNGIQVIYHDVPKTSWFATYVLGVAQRKLLSGYANKDGTPSDRFGPGDSVTLAQLAKIVLSLSAVDLVRAGTQPQNPSANDWSSNYIATAESQDWIVFTDPTTDVHRPASRGEVLATLLQGLNIPLQWATGTKFSDVSRRTPYANAIETAAAAGIVSGRTKDDGTPTGDFGPSASVTRAEMAKIVLNAIDKYRLASSSSSSSVSSP
jgi:hypothetical protein